MQSDNLNTIAEEKAKQYTTLNLGPTHPATHGIFQNVLKMDGEIIVDATPTIGYIHRAFEKIAEHKPFYQITPLTDRLNYCSSPINNMGWHMTVEKLIKAELAYDDDAVRGLKDKIRQLEQVVLWNESQEKQLAELTTANK